MIASAPRSRAAASFSAVLAPAMTRAPIALPISTAVRPTPPAAPSTSSVSPARSRPCQRIATWLEIYAIGNAPASSNGIASGVANVSASSASLRSSPRPHARQITALISRKDTRGSLLAVAGLPMQTARVVIPAAKERDHRACPCLHASARNPADAAAHAAHPGHRGGRIRRRRHSRQSAPVPRHVRRPGAGGCLHVAPHALSRGHEPADTSRLRAGRRHPERRGAGAGAGEARDGHGLHLGQHHRPARGARRAGRRVEDLEVIWAVRTATAATTAGARRLARPTAVHWGVLRWGGHWLEPAGIRLPKLEIPEAVHTIYPDLSHAQDWEAAIDATSFVSDEIVAELCDALGLIGAPGDCAGRIVEMAKLGVRNLYLMPTLTFGPPSPEIVAFRDVVFPRLLEAGLKLSV